MKDKFIIEKYKGEVILQKYTGNEECVVVSGNIDAVSSDAFTKIDYETSEEYDFGNVKKIVFSE